MADQFDADAGFLRGAGSGRKHDAFGVHRLDLSDGYFVVAANLYLGAQFSEVLDEVVSERIVVIEDEDHVFIVAPEARFPLDSQWFNEKAKAVRPERQRIDEPRNLETSLLLDRHAANCHAYRRFPASL